ncbi:MAG: hypothetical protein AAFV45_11890 [Pseudomonadota bacterium]
MWIVLIPLVVVTAAFWLLMAFAAWRSIQSLRHQRWVSLAIFLTIIAFPMGLYFERHATADQIEADRANAVAAFVRHPMPASYPSLLEIRGAATTNELIVYLATLAIDEIHIVQSNPRAGQQYVVTYSLAADCLAQGAHLLEELKTRGRLRYATPSQKKCLIQDTGYVDANRDHIPAIEFMAGTQTTLRQPGAGWYGGSFEARIRTANGSLLLDYWERPFIERPSSPGPWGYAFPANTDWKDYRTPNRLKFFAGAVGLLARNSHRTTAR